MVSRAVYVAPRADSGRGLVCTANVVLVLLVVDVKDRII